MARHLIKPADDERGPTLREVKRFNSLLEGTHFFSPEFPDKQDLRLHLTEVLEKGIDPAQLRQILFWDITEFRTVILNALHARSEKLISN